MKTQAHKIRFIFFGLCLIMGALMGIAHHPRLSPAVKIKWPAPQSVVAVQVLVQGRAVFQAAHEQGIWLVTGDEVAFNIPTEVMDNFLSQAAQAQVAVLVQKNGAQEVRHLYGLDENNAHHLVLSLANGKQVRYVLGALAGDGGSVFMWQNEAVYSLPFAAFYELLNGLIADVIERKIA